MKKIIIALIIGVILSILVPFTASADTIGYFHDHTCYMELGPWVWDEAELGGAWVRPDTAIGYLDLRSYAEMAQQGGTPGWGVFFCTEPITDKSYIAIGTDFNLNLPSAVKNTLEHKYNITIEAYSINGTMWELYVEHGDPTGQDRWKPLLPHIDGTITIDIQGFSPVTFAKDPPRFPYGWNFAHRPFMPWGWAWGWNRNFPYWGR